MPSRVSPKGSRSPAVRLALAALCALLLAAQLLCAAGAEAAIHPTTREVFCLSPHRGQVLQCEYFVRDETGAAERTTPTGKVSLNASIGSSSIPVTPRECTLEQWISPVGPVKGVGVCSFTVTPSPQGDASAPLHVGGTYFGGDGVHEAGGTEITMTVPGVSHTGVTCTPAKAVVGHTMVECLITVEAPAGQSLPPNSSAFLGDSQAAVFPGSHACNLPPTTTRTSSCSVQFQPSVAGHPTLTGKYFGQAEALEPSEATTSIEAFRETKSAIGCEPGAVTPGEPVTCTVTVEDPLAGAASEVVPAGSAELTITGPGGSFPQGASCELAPTGSGNSASCQATYVPAKPGEHVLSAAYSGDANHLPSQSGQRTTLVHRPTSTSVECSPPQVRTGMAASCTATVTDLSASVAQVGGTVTFFSAGQGGFEGGSSCQLAPAQADDASACSVTYLPTAAGTGRHQISALYNGAGGADASQGSTTLLVGNPTSTAVNCTPAPLVLGESAACKATVVDSSSQLEPLTGSVTFTHAGSGALSGQGTCQVVEAEPGIASCSVTYTPQNASAGLGQHSVAAAYGGDALHAVSQGEVQVVVLDPTQTQLVCGAASPVEGQTAHCTATVTASLASPSGPAGGAIHFSTDAPGGSFAAEDCTVEPDGQGGFSCGVDYVTAAGSAGVHHLSARYEGDSGYAASTVAQPTSLQVQAKHGTTTTLGCEEEAVTLGGAAVCTVTVEDTQTPKLTPVGQVGVQSDKAGSFSANGTCSLSEVGPGVAHCELVFTPAALGSHHLKATYAGDEEHSGGAGELTLAVAAPASSAHPSSLAFECEPSAVLVGDFAVCTVTVRDTAVSGATAPAGAVVFGTDGPGQFKPGGCTLFPIAGEESRCQVFYAPSQAGASPHTITAAYAGDANHRPKVGAAQVSVAGPGDGHGTLTTVSCQPASTVVGVAVPCTASVENTDGSNVPPTGSVFFSTDSVGKFAVGGCALTPSATGSSCTVSYEGLQPGEDEITAIYEGDSGATGADAHKPSSGTTEVTVNGTAPPHPTVAAMSCAPATLVLGSGVSNCTITVEDTVEGTAATHPSGEVSIRQLVGEGQLSATSCKLPKTGPVKASCQVIAYTPAAVGEHRLEAVYRGDLGHEGSAATAAMTVSAPPAHPTSTAVQCSPATLAVGAASTCVATVTDGQNGASPTGTVKFGSDSPGAFGAGGVCTLAAAGAGRAACQLAYTPGAPGSGTHTVTASYQGDSGHVPSGGTASLAVTAAAPDTKIGGHPRSKTTVLTARLRFSSTEPGSSFRCKLDRKPARPCASPFRAKVRPGRHTFSVQAVNAQGVADPSPAVFRWKVLKAARRSR